MRAPADEPAFFDDLEESSADDEFEQDLLEPPEMSQMLFVDVVLLCRRLIRSSSCKRPTRHFRSCGFQSEEPRVSPSATRPEVSETPRPLTHELLTQFSRNTE